jgi:DHA2 family multidrug resistance protein
MNAPRRKQLGASICGKSSVKRFWKLCGKRTGASVVRVARLRCWVWNGQLFNIEYWDVFWAEFIQGASMGLVFVPLMVLTMAFTPKERTGNATGLFNMMRNIGGGVGISMVATMLTRMGQQHTNLLVANITPLSPPVLRLLGGLRGLFAGSGPILADQQAYAALFSLVQRQAAMVALVRVFQYLGVLVLILIPLIAFTERPHKGESSQPIGH